MTLRGAQSSHEAGFCGMYDNDGQNIVDTESAEAEGWQQRSNLWMVHYRLIDFIITRYWEDSALY